MVSVTVTVTVTVTMVVQDGTAAMGRFRRKEVVLDYRV